MVNKRVVWVIVVGLLLAGILASGCVSPHAGEIKQAESLIHSADSRLAFLKTANMTEVSVPLIRANATGAKTDLQEAKKILEKIPVNELGAQEQADMNAVLILVDVNIDLADLFAGPLADFIEDGQVIVKSKDPSAVSDAGTKMKADLSKVRQRIVSITSKMNTIDEGSVSPALKGNIAALKSMANSFDAETRKAEAQLASTCIMKCTTGFVLGTDCQCHPACGKYFCTGDAVCCKDTCYVSPRPGLKINMNTCTAE